ncbi:uncharacterized protein K452DRAFT_325417 [Aplosporella prunicola CBS 121167]|uniref:ubiquitinyl hydrolase 1 n=1 Tax=Aplosporella prunicola CBS 121167 TaxID=1176127 RepID=A0A6A6BMX9_9PEZI|nr:uncharacterized protein K452DRAFT_325417 [Aplosporella prunicola CBS 121167]KAF2144177.1 hypothetical protein K452DRAFT_325417 [Aplosporella prunicola CBS 121167]
MRLLDDDDARPLFFKTASIKKRKLAQDPPDENSSHLPAPLSTSASPPSSPHPPSVGSRSSASPPRYIPPHLHDEVFESSPDDSTNTAGSSPTDAYAGLTLSTAGDRRSSSEDTPSKTSSTQPATLLRSEPRAVSPAKRSASEMTGEDDNKDHMDMDDGAVRDSSVDMLRDERTTVEANGNASSSDTTTATSNNESNTVSTSATSEAGPSPSTSAQKPANDVPAIDDQVSQIMAINAKELVEGQKGYVVSMWWLSRVLSRVSDSKQFGSFDKSRSEGDIGPINNTEIYDEDYLADENGDIADENGLPFIPIKPNLTYGDDFEIFPEEAWRLMVQWYGVKQGNPPIERYVRDTAPPESPTKNLQYEVYPPFFTIRKLRNGSEPMSHQQLKENQSKAIRLLSSRTEKFQKFLKRAKSEASIPLTTKVQVWRILEPIQADTAAPQESKQTDVLTPATSRSGSPARSSSVSLVIDMATFTSMTEGVQREMIDAKDETNNPKYNGSAKMEIVGLNSSQVLILEEQIGGPGGGEFVSANARGKLIKHGASASEGKNVDQKKALDSGRSSPVPGPMTRGRARNGRTRGTTGLSNLGNTCYMNSALQCIRSVEELTMYFMQQKFKEELNPDNPLGYGGSIAKSYAGLLAALYDEAAPSSFSPKNFKYALGRAQPMFSGYGQQDSQEFLSFLVDGLHEDLNRIQKKPYIENPDSEDNTHKDPEAIKALGEKYRENHRARNDSVAVDLFNGFYKNTMVCPECDKVSITFDPYSSLTLQLPIEKNWQHTFNFVPLRGKPIQIVVDIEQNKPFSAVKEFIAARVPDLDPKLSVCVEVYNNKFYKVFDDKKAISEQNISDRDDLFCYELDLIPTNWPSPKKTNKARSMFGNASDDEDLTDGDSPLADRIMVPVLHRAQHGYNKGMKLWPFYIVLTREEARNFDEIHRKVITRVATMTTRDILSEDSLNSRIFDSKNGSDTVITTEEDASSTTDGRVQANSVEGDESIVDVTMTESSDADKTTAADDNADDTVDDDVTMQEQSSVPEVLKYGSYIPPELQRLFTMKYYKAGNELLPTGWTGLDNTRELPTIASRMPVSQSRRSSFQSNASHGSRGSRASHRSDTPESEEGEDTPQFSNNSMDFSEVQSEDELAPMTTNKFANRQKFNKNRDRKTKGRNKKMTTYSRKGAQKRERHAERATSEPVSEPDGNPALIRLGELMVLDWDTDSFDALFGGRESDKNDMRGVDSMRVMETLEDPELDEKKRRRAAKKKSGITLEDCFAETAKTEVLSEENAWYCNRCKELRRASKTLEIWTAPDILVIHLKRFGANRGFRDKIDILIDFPIEGLDISDRVGLKEDKSLVYDLFAVDNHFGGLGGGHYTAVAQNFYDKKWYDYNDSMVNQKSPQGVVSSSAYLLFYRRRQPEPLGPAYLQQIVREAYAAPDPNAVSGNGQRLGSASPTGSSSGLGAAPHGAGSAPGTMTTTTEMTGTSYENEEAPPPYGADEEDEGVSMPGLSGLLAEDSAPQWSFEHLEQKPSRRAGSDTDVESGVDAASGVAAGLDGSDAGSMADQQRRLEADFASDVDPDPYQSGNGNVTPADSEGVVNLNVHPGVPELAGTEEDDGPVAEVRVDEDEGAAAVATATATTTAPASATATAADNSTSADGNDNDKTAKTE